MRNPLGDKQRLLHIRDAIENIFAFTKGMDERAYISNVMVQSAVERQMEIIGEAVNSVSDELKEKHTDIEWYKIKAFRNVIAHEYFGISNKQVWNVVANELPHLKTSIEKILLSFDIQK